MPNRLCIIGSLNMDLVVRVPLLPAPGETLMASAFATFPGGKGANQAVAAARMGAHVSMIGAVGDDAHGHTLRATLSAEGIDTSGISTQRAVPTGTALITVAPAGRNTIIVVPGANAALGKPQLDSARHLIEQADIVLMQLEIPMSTVTHAAMLARDAGREVFLNAAPAAPLPNDLLPLLDTLIVNETEAAAITGEATNPLPALEQVGVRTVVLTLGERGLQYAHAGARGSVPPFPVTPVDSVGAGDAFAGTLAALWRPREPTPIEALRWASAAGALATTKQGAIPSLPRFDSVRTLIQSGPARRADERGPGPGVTG